MTLLKIARMGHPVLLQTAEPVTNIAAPEFQRFLDDMLDTMRDAGGVGLAAPQVHVSKRVFVYYVPASRQEEGEAAPEGDQVLINPVITGLGEERLLKLEGCLSIPGLRGWVPRHARVRYEGYDRRGNFIAGTAMGFHANVLQHETDHLDGILYPMRMSDLGLMGFDPEVTRFLPPERIAARTDYGA